MKPLSMICSLVGMLSLTTASYAASFVVPSGTTAPAQTLTNVGDTGLIEAGGTISSGAASGVTMLNDDQALLNDGLITITGSSHNGVLNNAGATGLGNNSQITNNGTILTTGLDGDGILNEAGATGGGNNVQITNKGAISTTAGSAFGISNEAGLGVGAHDVQITNNGTISTVGSTSIGIFNEAGPAGGAYNVQITNNGTISTTGVGAFGIFNRAGAGGANNVQVTNCGTIVTTAPSTFGIFNQGSQNFTLINCGTIATPQTLAINIIGDLHPTLTLLQGSNIQGGVHSDSPLNINVGPALNLLLTLDSTSAGFIPGQIADPFVIVGNTIAVLDPVGLALQADVIADLSDALLIDIYRWRAAFTCCCCRPCSRELWAEGLGSYRKRSHGVDGYENWQGGFLVGYDVPLFCGNAGVFGGASFGEATASRAQQGGDHASYVGGLSYERICCRTFIGAALVAGYTSLDNSRFVANNLVPGGIQIARSQAQGFFISPEITCAQQLVGGYMSAIVSGTLRYAGLFLGNYGEHGSSADFTVRDRNIQLLTARGELSFPLALCCGLCLEPYVGAFGRFQVSESRLNGELLGTLLSFDPGGPRNLGAVLVGLRGDKKWGRFDLFLNVEGSFDNHKSNRVLGEGGIGHNF
ncbi:MAG: hypothetical protein JSR80_06785 [Verrucomicrobia bacterium]|nr:hypothetical protein [Verrucomicrobiota bacterium]